MFHFLLKILKKLFFVWCFFLVSCGGVKEQTNALPIYLVSSQHLYLDFSMHLDGVVWIDAENKPHPIDLAASKFSLPAKGGKTLIGYVPADYKDAVTSIRLAFNFDQSKVRRISTKGDLSPVLFSLDANSLKPKVEVSIDESQHKAIQLFFDVEGSLIPREDQKADLSLKVTLLSGDEGVSQVMPEEAEAFEEEAQADVDALQGVVTRVDLSGNKLLLDVDEKETAFDLSQYPLLYNQTPLDLSAVLPGQTVKVLGKNLQLQSMELVANVYKVDNESALTFSISAISAEPLIQMRDLSRLVHVQLADKSILDSINLDLAEFAENTVVYLRGYPVSEGVFVAEYLELPASMEAELIVDASKTPVTLHAQTSGDKVLLALTAEASHIPSVLRSKERNYAFDYPVDHIELSADTRITIHFPEASADSHYQSERLSHSDLLAFFESNEKAGRALHRVTGSGLLSREKNFLPSSITFFFEQAANEDEYTAVEESLPDKPKPLNGVGVAGIVLGALLAPPLVFAIVKKIITRTRSASNANSADYLSRSSAADTMTEIDEASVSRDIFPKDDENERLVNQKETLKNEAGNKINQESIVRMYPSLFTNFQEVELADVSEAEDESEGDIVPSGSRKPVEVPVDDSGIDPDVEDLPDRKPSSRLAELNEQIARAEAALFNSRYHHAFYPVAETDQQDSVGEVNFFDEDLNGKYTVSTDGIKGFSLPEQGSIEDYGADIISGFKQLPYFISPRRIAKKVVANANTKIFVLNFLSVVNSFMIKHGDFDLGTREMVLLRLNEYIESQWFKYKPSDMGESIYDSYEEELAEGVDAKNRFKLDFSPEKNQEILAMLEPVLSKRGVETALLFEKYLDEENSHYKKLLDYFEGGPFRERANLNYKEYENALKIDRHRYKTSFHTDHQEKWLQDIIKRGAFNANDISNMFNTTVKSYSRRR